MSWTKEGYKTVHSNKKKNNNDWELTRFAFYLFLVLLFTVFTFSDARSLSGSENTALKVNKRYFDSDTVEWVCGHCGAYNSSEKKFFDNYSCGGCGGSK